MIPIEENNPEKIRDEISFTLTNSSGGIAGFDSGAVSFFLGLPIKHPFFSF